MQGVRVAGGGAGEGAAWRGVARALRELTLMPTSSEVMPTLEKKPVTAASSSTSAEIDGSPMMSMFHW